MESREDKTQWNESCTEGISEDDWASLNIVRSVAASFGAVIMVAILVFLIRSRAYKTLFQRLYLYLIIATLLNEVVGVVSIEHHWYYLLQEKVCVWIGLFTGWTYVLLFIFSYEIIFQLLFLVVWQIKGGPQFRIGRNRICKCFGYATIDTVMILLPISIATAFVVPPYIQNRYGIAGPWCFVQSVTNINGTCYATGKTIQTTFYGMYMAVGAAGILASVIFTIVYFRLSVTYKEARLLLKRTLIVLVFKCVHIVFIICSVACRFYTLQAKRRRKFGLWVLHAISVPLGVLVFPLGYLVCFYPVIKIARGFYEKLSTNHSKKKDSNNRTDAAEDATAPRSERVSQPSDTFFHVSHPDELTDQTSLISDAWPVRSYT